MLPSDRPQKIVVVDSTYKGIAGPLPHSMHAIVYVPSWITTRWKFSWKTTTHVIHTLEIMKEYWIAAPHRERPIRAQRCLYSIKALNTSRRRFDGLPHFSPFARAQISTIYDNLDAYLTDNPVIAFDWITSWAECRAMAQAYPKQYIRMFRGLRVKHIRRQLELQYFLDIMQTVADEQKLDMEFK